MCTLQIASMAAIWIWNTPGTVTNHWSQFWLVCSIEWKKSSHCGALVCLNCHDTDVVGRKFVQYTVHLYSTALGPPAILQSLSHFLIIFEPRNLWELRAIHNPGQNPKIGKFTTSISTPKDFKIPQMNSPYSKSGTYMQIHALYEEIWNLPCFCLPIWKGTWLEIHTSIYC